jgi:hypothetical protein
MRHHFRHPQAMFNKGSLFYSHCGQGQGKSNLLTNDFMEGLDTAAALKLLLLLFDSTVCHFPPSRLFTRCGILKVYHRYSIHMNPTFGL